RADLLGAHALLRRDGSAIRQMGPAQSLDAHPDAAFHVGVPRRQVLVADRPVDAVAVAQVRPELEVAPAPAQPAPDQAAPAQLVAADPAERLALGSDVRVPPV